MVKAQENQNCKGRGYPTPENLSLTEKAISNLATRP
jgi:hypothetical protein